MLCYVSGIRWTVTPTPLPKNKEKSGENKQSTIKRKFQVHPDQQHGRQPKNCVGLNCHRRLGAQENDGARFYPSYAPIKSEKSENVTFRERELCGTYTIHRKKSRLRNVVLRVVMLCMHTRLGHKSNFPKFLMGTQQDLEGVQSRVEWNSRERT